MRKLKNPWAGKQDYHCFGCCPDNHEGLKMEFYEEGDEILCFWCPQHHHQGWTNVLHGGIEATLLDEICGWVLFRKLQCSGVTSKLDVRYLKPILVTEPQLTLRAHLVETKRNLAMIEAQIENAAGEVCTKAEAVYFCFSKEKSAEMGFTACEAEEEQLLSL